MPVLLRCDCPGCDREIPAVFIGGRITALHPWWAQPAGEGLLVACRVEHLNAALSQWVRPPTEEPQA